jgi:hypothetical protein
MFSQYGASLISSLSWALQSCGAEVWIDDLLPEYIPYFQWFMWPEERYSLHYMSVADD